jgi:hypothetical protein
MRGVNHPAHLKNRPSALLRTVPLEFPNRLVFLLSLSQLPCAVELKVLIYPFLGLLLSLRLDLTWVKDELILHNYGHVPNAQLWLVGLY